MIHEKDYDPRCAVHEIIQALLHSVLPPELSAATLELA
jgi:hypothetical protein